MRYYGQAVDNPEADNYGGILAVGRWYEDDEGEIALEKWADGKWVDWPELLAASGMGGSNPFIPITETEAITWIEGNA